MIEVLLTCLLHALQLQGDTGGLEISNDPILLITFT